MSAGHDPHGMTRAGFLARGAAGAAALGVGGALAACGSDDDAGSTGGTGTTRAAKPKTGGTLRIGMLGGGPSDTLDPNLMIGTPDFARSANLYDPLTDFDPDYKLYNVLAEELTSNAEGDVWTIRLKDGIELHDGRTLTADDLRYCLSVYAAESDIGRRLRWVEPDQIKKVDERTVRLELSAPRANVPVELAGWSAGIFPEGFDPKNPIGTGPFKYESLAVGQQSVFKRNENYWREVYADELQIISFADPTAAQNALLSGQIDAMDGVPYSQLALFENEKSLKVVEYESAAWSPFCMRVDVEPYSDPRVREAVRLLVDRQQIVDVAYGGHARVANDIYAPNDPGYNSELPQRTQDLEKAKSLVAAAGVTELTLNTSSVAAGIAEASDLFAEQANGAGFKVKLKKIDPGEFYGENYLSYPFSVDAWSGFPWLANTDSMLRANECHWAVERPGGMTPEEEQWLRLYNQAQSTVDEAQRNQLISDAQEIEYHHGGYVVFAFRNIAFAASAKVDGWTAAPVGYELSDYRFRLLHFV